MTKKQYSYILTVLLAFSVFLSGCQSGQKQTASKNEEKARVVKTINGKCHCTGQSEARRYDRLCRDHACIRDQAAWRNREIS